MTESESAPSRLLQARSFKDSVHDYGKSPTVIQIRH